MSAAQDSIAPPQRQPHPLEVLKAFCRLGCISFGGPIAHLGYFRSEFVERRRWLDDSSYGDLVAMCQFLPGPASSQVGAALGYIRAGWAGALMAWLGFTLPSALALTVFAMVSARLPHAQAAPWLHGLKIMTVAVVAQAVWTMGKSLCPDARRASIAAAAVAAMAVCSGAAAQIGVILMGALLGRLFIPAVGAPHRPQLHLPAKFFGRACLGLFFALLIGLPLATKQWHLQALSLFDCFYRAGAIVFGGGHVVLPVLQAGVVTPQWVSNDAFLAGYGAAQAVPGPLFTFAAYLGAVSHLPPNGWLGAAIALIAIFLPGLLLVFGALPILDAARKHPSMQQAMQGVNAAVVGLLLSALYQSVWVNAVHTGLDFAYGVMAFVLLVFWKVPPWCVVLICAAAAGAGGMG